MNAKPLLKRTLIYFAYVLGSFLLVAAVLFLFLQTGFAKSRIASRLSGALSGPDRRVSIGELKGMVPFQWHVDRITIGDIKGTWLIFNDLRLRWSPLALLRGKIYLKDLSAGDVVIERTPVERKKEPWRAPTLPKELPPIEVSRIKIERLTLHEPVLGQSAVFEIKGGIRSQKSGLIVPLTVSRKDSGPETNLGLTIALYTEPESFGINAVLREDEGGFAAMMMGLKKAGPLSVRVKGSGPLKAWKGRIVADAQRIGFVRANIGLAIAGEISADVEGHVVPAAAILPSGLKPLFGSKNSFAIDAGLIPDQRLKIKKAEFWAENYSAGIEGSLDIKSRQVRSDFFLGVTDLGTLSKLIGMPVEGEIALSGDLSGTIRRPELNADIELTGLRLQETTIKEARADLSILPNGPVSLSFPGMGLKAEGTILGISRTNEKPFPVDSLQWFVNLNVPAKGPFVVNAFRISGNDIALNMAGRIFPADRSGDITASLGIEDLRPFTSYFGKTVSGSLFAETRLRGSLRNGTASGELQGHTRQIGNLPEPLPGLFAPKTLFYSSFELGRTERLTVPCLRIDNCFFTLISELGLNLEGETLSGSWQLKLPRAEAIPIARVQGISGGFEAQGRVYGSFDDFDVKMVLNGESVQIGRAGFQNISADFEAQGLPNDPAGNICIVLNQCAQSLTVSSGFNLQEDAVNLYGLTLSAPKNRVAGDLILDTNDRLVQGRLEGEFEELSILGRFFGADLGGRAALRADFSSESGQQNAAVSATGEDLNLPFGEVSRVNLSSDMRDLFGLPKGTINLSLRELDAPQIEIAALDFRAEGNEQGGSFNLTAQGQATRDFAVETGGTFVLTAETKQLRLDMLQAHFADYPIQLLQPAAVTHSQGRSSLDRLGLAVGSGRLYASGYADKNVSLAVSFQDLPLSISQLFLEPGLEGSLHGDISLQGNLSNPQASAEIRMTGVSLPGEYERVLIPELRAGISLADRLTTEINLREPNRFADVNFEVPVEFSLEPLVFSLPGTNNIQGSLDASLNLEAVRPFIPEDNVLGGVFTADLDIRGTLAHPEISGTAGIENGSYQNLTAGTILSNLRIDLTAKGSRVQIERMSAADGGNGVITGRGFVDFAEETGFPIELALDFRKATVVRRDDITGTISGEVSMAGPVRKADISGGIRVDRAEISLEKPLPPDIPALEVIEVGGPGMRTVKKAEEKPPGFDPKLNLQVSLPAQIFVSGRGLESEWGGDLDISGSLENPVITGSINVIRGNFVFLDKRFDLSKGTIQFFGAAPPAPGIDLTAEAKTEEITAFVALTGPASNPTIELRSDPSLPEDEILARLLFGESLAGITPIQALRLANALNTLRGGGTGFDILGKTRRLIGVEELELREREGGPAVAIGKYLTEEVYVDVEQGLGAETGRVRVEVEVSPNVTLETETGLNTTSGIGVKWKREY